MKKAITFAALILLVLLIARGTKGWDCGVRDDGTGTFYIECQEDKERVKEDLQNIKDRIAAELKEQKEKYFAQK